MTKTLVTALLALVMTMHPPAPPGFGDDVEFLKSHTRVLLLGRGDAQVAVCPAYQGRVMTSTASGPSGLSLGWIHREHIGAGQLVPHINVFGGEDRFWIGPEGGQFSIFFKKGDPFDLEHWQTPTGLLSVWLLGMFPPSPTAIVVIPFRPGPPASLGPVVNDAYFGKVPADRLAVDRNVLFFRADGQYRGKIGLSSRRAKPLLGSYDSANGILTLVQYTLPAGITDYVNSMWEIQKDPYGGDTVNSYNDGPPQPGAKPLGPFYEIETSSPAAALAPGSSLVHMHRTFHFVGSDRDLDPIVRATLGVGLDEIRKALPAR